MKARQSLPSGGAANVKMHFCCSLTASDHVETPPVAFSSLEVKETSLIPYCGRHITTHYLLTPKGSSPSRVHRYS